MSLARLRAQGPAGTVTRRVRRLSRHEAVDRDEEIAAECAVALVYNDEPHAVMMATPLDLEDFALGFSLSEGVIERREDLHSIRVHALDRGLQVSMCIPDARLQALRQRRRGLEGRSGCGLCGLRSIEDALRPPRRVPAGVVVERAALRRALAELTARQPLNAATGAIHAAAWAGADGRIEHLREDVGRHNALDKLIGALSAAAVEPARGFAVLTSRASYEMVMKAAAAGIPLIAAISAPTALAVAMAQEAGLTLLGFARDERCTVYSCAGRLRATTPAAAPGARPGSAA